MGVKSVQAVWRLVRAQHGVISRKQLLAFGYSAKAIDHRISIGRLHPVFAGVYAVGRPEITREGRWMAAVLACGDGAALSHRSAGCLLQVGSGEGDEIDVAVPAATRHKRRGITVHRRAWIEDHHRMSYNGIPVTTPLVTLVDLASVLDTRDTERAINEADKKGLINPETLRAGLDELPTIPGLAPLRRILDRRTFVLTDSELERLFLPIVRRAGLAKPLTREKVIGFRVDFFWPELGLVVETDGLKYHRTPSQQAKDRRRDQVHTAAGLMPLRFTHDQIKYEPDYVRATLATVARRLR